MTSQITVLKNIDVQMRDGILLATDVYLPKDDINLPALVQRTPYDKENVVLRNYSLDVLRAVQQGYAVVVQDTRGCYRSEGVFYPFFDDGNDGADTIAWAASQRWSSGAVGMIGGSYFGATQWRAASEVPEALKAIAPHVTAADYHDGWVYRGGAFELGFCLNWSLARIGIGALARRRMAGIDIKDDFDELIEMLDNIYSAYEYMPPADIPLLRNIADYYGDWLAHPCYDEYWKKIAPREYHDIINVPALNTGSWYDLFLSGTLANYIGMKENGPNNVSRRPHLIIGPWAHGNYSGWFPERHYGFRASREATDPTAVHLRWFDHHLRGIDNGVDQDPPVRLFVMGSNEWRYEPDWPLPDTTFTPYYLHSKGHANTASGDGTLSIDFPADEPTDSYLYDPTNPVPTIGGACSLPGGVISANAGPRDQRPIDLRHDILSFISEPFRRPLEVIGPLVLVLYVSSSALDTDFTGKLIDVHPNGRAEILTDGILRVRYRESRSNPVLIEPGHIYKICIDLVATATVFLPGHRIRLDVSSSNFPRFDRNTNTGGMIAYEPPGAAIQALNRVYHDRDHPSHLVLPIIDRGRS